MTGARAWLLVILLLLAWTAIPDGPAAADLAATPAPIPSCTEDAVLVGTGDFEDGRWTTYTCGPSVDD